MNVHYHTGHNMPGYLPESDVYRHETVEDALADLSETVERHYEMDCDIMVGAINARHTHGFQDARDVIARVREYESAKDELANADGPVTIYAADLAYWVNECAEDCEEEDDD